MTTKFTKGGILSSNQLEDISNKKWKKGGILSATQLNELSKGSVLKTVVKTINLASASNQIEIPVQEVPDSFVMFANRVTASGITYPADTGALFAVFKDNLGNNYGIGYDSIGNGRVSKYNVIIEKTSDKITISSSTIPFIAGNFYCYITYMKA